MSLKNNGKCKLLDVARSVFPSGEFQKYPFFSGYPHTHPSLSLSHTLYLHQIAEHRAKTMMLNSISTLSSSSSFLSDTPSTSNSTLFRNATFPSFLVGFPKPPFSNTTLRLKPSFSSASSTQQDNGSPEQFLKNNSMADFLRFKKGIDGATGVLQTAVVSYKRKFPWSLLRPFLQVT